MCGLWLIDDQLQVFNQIKAQRTRVLGLDHHVHPIPLTSDPSKADIGNADPSSQDDKSIVEPGEVRVETRHEFRKF